MMDTQAYFFRIYMPAGFHYTRYIPLGCYEMGNSASVNQAHL